MYKTEKPDDAEYFSTNFNKKKILKVPRGNTVNKEVELVKRPIRTLEGDTDVNKFTRGLHAHLNPDAEVFDVMDRRPTSFHPGPRLETFSMKGGRSFDTKYPTSPNIWPYRKVVSESIYYLLSILSVNFCLSF